MCLRLIPSSCDYVRMLQASGAWFSFNALNPTGHYRLELSSPVDYAVAERLAILDNWESSVRRAEGKPDVSQVGNFSHARNVQFSNCPLPRSFTEWIPAEYDVPRAASQRAYIIIYPYMMYIMYVCLYSILCRSL